MLHLSALTYRLGERLLIDNASAALPSGARYDSCAFFV
jgi:hypothetical protein